jgi:hypothetical protein
LEKQRKKKEEVMVDTELVEPEVEQARVADDGADDTEIDPSPPMPRLPGYPPLSEIDQRYNVKDSIKSSAEFVNTNVSKVEDTSSGVDNDSSCDTQGCDLHPICYNQEEPTE